MQKVMIVAGEPSGDLHASHVVPQLKALAPDVTLFGMGGDLMEKAGVTLNVHIRDSAVMGFAEVLGALPMFLRKQAYLKRQIRQQRPDVLLLIDFADFNMPLAKYAWQHDVPVFYYIPPKAWAWRAARARKLAKWAHRIAAIFPFEAEFYRNAGANVVFVGHPLIDFARTALTPEAARRKFGLSTQDDAPVIGLLPGSRSSEIRHILPTVLKSAAYTANVYPNAQWLLLLAPGISQELISECKGRISGVPPIKIIRAAAPFHDANAAEAVTYPVMRAATLLLVTTGTATLEAACIGTPMVILFRTSTVNWQIIKALSPLQRAGLPNLIAGKQIVPELLQASLTPTTLTEHALELLRDAGKQKAQRHALRNVHAMLGTPGAAKRTAEEVFESTT